MSEVPLKPIGREDIHKLESALMVGTLFRPEVIEALRESTARVTWVDSLAAAAGAIARSKAGMPVSRIAEELGRTEATIREHIAGKTKAGQLVLETYNWLVKEGGKFEIFPPIEGSYKLLKKEELEKTLKRLEELIGELLESIKGQQERLDHLKEELNLLVSKLK